MTNRTTPSRDVDEDSAMGAITPVWGAQAPSPAVFGALAGHILNSPFLPAGAPAAAGEAPALP